MLFVLIATALYEIAHYIGGSPLITNEDDIRARQQIVPQPLLTREYP